MHSSLQITHLPDPGSIAARHFYTKKAAALHTKLFSNYLVYLRSSVSTRTAISSIGPLPFEARAACSAAGPSRQSLQIKRSGTGSAPPRQYGLHLPIRPIPSKMPRNGPNLLTASAVYCEQLGSNLQQSPQSGAKNRCQNRISTKRTVSTVQLTGRNNRRSVEAESIFSWPVFI